MSKEHEALKEIARKVLIEKGFKTTEIKEEFWVGGNGLKSFRVDVVGLTDNNKVAIECGTTPGEKIAALKMFFDEVIVLPYFTINQDRESDIRTIRELQEKINKIEIENKELKIKTNREEHKYYIIRALLQDAVEISYRWLSQKSFYNIKQYDKLSTLISEMRQNLIELENAGDSWNP